MDKKEVILITGSSGRIGIATVKKFANNFRIVGFELLKAFYAAANEELVPCDISSDESVHQAFKHIRAFYGNHLTSVIHLAAYYNFSEKESPLYHKITVEGTKRLLQALQSFQVEQFIFTSTMLVHAPRPPNQKITEESPIKANWGYPRSKVETEAVIHAERGNIPTVILRVSGVYDDQCHSIPLSNQIQRIYENQLNAHLFSGNIEHGTDFIHMNDLVDAIAQCVSLRHSLPPELVLLIGEGKTYSYDFLQRKIRSLLYGDEIRTYSLPKTLAKMGAIFENTVHLGKHEFIKPWMIDLADENYDLNISKAKKFLQWTPRHSLDKTLPLMINDLKRDPLAWYKKNGLDTRHLKVHAK